MVIKKCKICGEEFEARGSDLTCSFECRKINNRNHKKKYKQSEKGKAAERRYRQSDKGRAAEKRRRKSDAFKATQKRYRQSNKGKKSNRKRQKKYQHSDKGKATKKKYIQNKIAELNKKYDGDLDLILKDCPMSWLEREAIMQVEFGVSYAEAMFKKMELNPVCEITGESGDLVIHHLDSFNLYPEKGADLDNLVRVKSEIHDDFHNEYGRGNNTREQWFEFLEKNRNIYK